MPSPSTSTIVRSMPGNEEKAPLCVTSARLTRHAKSSGVPLIASSVVSPWPLRQGMRGRSDARVIVVLIADQST